MHQFFDNHISIATIEDVPLITALLNSAYRGESSKQGWTTEAHLIGGEVRATNKLVQEVVELPNSIVLKYTNEQQEIIGCVNLQQQANKLYLGMFSVQPQLQGGGIGKKLLFAADEYAKSIGCMSIYMSVISVRTELINWYKRHGYVETGERKPFIEDGITGNHKQTLEFLYLEKVLV